MVRHTGVPLDAKPLSQRLAGTVCVRLGDQDFARRERICELVVDGGEVPKRRAKNEREIGGKHLGLIANRRAFQSSWAYLQCPHYHTKNNEFPQLSAFLTQEIYTAFRIGVDAHPRRKELYQSGLPSSYEFIKVVSIEIDDLARGYREGEGDER